MSTFQIGCDIVQICRIRPSLAKKVLTAKELDEFKTLSGPRAIEYLAGHFASKEAIFKTLDKPAIDFRTIEIQYDQNRKPFGIVEGETISLSISHERDYAMAIALRISS